MANRSGTLRIAKWPGDVSILWGMSPGGPPPVTILTDATSNFAVCAQRTLEASANALAAIRMALISGTSQRYQTSVGRIFSGRLSAGRLYPPENSGRRSLPHQGRRSGGQ